MLTRRWRSSAPDVVARRWRPLELRRVVLRRVAAVGVGDDLAAALPAWVAARVIVFATVVGARGVVAGLAAVPEPIVRHVAQGVLGWDAERYVQLAQRGYGELPLVDVRFFPLLPLATRALDRVLPGGTGFALLALTNVAALAFGVILHRLALLETGDHRLARRAAWFAAIFPSGFVLAWGYTEAPWCALTAGTFLAARRGRWWAAALLGAAAGLLRPVGLLLAVPLAIEAWRRRRGAPVAGAVAAMAAVVAPVVGAAAYLGWVARTFGDPLLPFTIQERSDFRGRPTDPLDALRAPATALARGEFTVASLRVLWALVLVALVVVVWRRWPAGYAAFATLSLAVALSTTRLGSFERYGFTAFPVLLALATVSARPLVERLLLLTGGALLGVYGLMALLGAYVP